jgi:sortase A
VAQSKVVSPNDASVLNPTPDNRLTLTTCHPRFTAAQRLIVIAKLAGKAVAAPITKPRVDAANAAKPTLSGETTPRQPAVGWGAAAVFAWLGTWALSRTWRKWPAYAVGAPVFIVVLFVFFENFSRLLPANI